MKLLAYPQHEHFRLSMAPLPLVSASACSLFQYTFCSIGYRGSSSIHSPCGLSADGIACTFSMAIRKGIRQNCRCLLCRSSKIAIASSRLIRSLIVCSFPLATCPLPIVCTNLQSTRHIRCSVRLSRK